MVPSSALHPRLALAGVAALLGGLVACRPDAPPPEAAELLPPPVTRAEMLAAEYPTDLVTAGSIRLEDGVFRAPAEGGAGEEVGAHLVEPLAFGALADGRPAAAAVLVMSGGGSGTFSWLYLLARDGGMTRVLADAYLGDRVELTGLTLAGDTITVTLVTQGPNDPMCCPTMVVERRFVFDGGGLVGSKP